MYVCAHVSTYLSFCWHSLRPLDTTCVTDKLAETVSIITFKCTTIYIPSELWKVHLDNIWVMLSSHHVPMYVYYFYINIYTQNYTWTIYKTLCLYIHIYISMYIYIYIQFCIYIYIYTILYIYIYIYNFVYIYIYNFVYIYLYSYII